MTTETLDQIAELLSEIGDPSAFSARRTRSCQDLHLEVKGLGQIHWPVSRMQAQQLCQIARPARYGQGEKTLLDRDVRDTWEIPKSRVKIDRRRWNRTLLPTLEQLGVDLGLAAGCRLKAELHAMLVYAPGQFFLPHQDSEKTDDMVATLVVTLPSSFKGGALIIEHQGESATYRGSKKNLSFVAFYADCRHEIRPVREGYRISLTYNLMLDSGAATSHPGGAEVAPASVDALVDRLHEHFETPLPPPWQKDAPLREPPQRLVYLLDHQYTERGLDWRRLKGNDAARSAALQAAAERYGCELVLALTEIHETWDCVEPEWGGSWYRQQHRWQHDEEDDCQDEELGANDPDAFELDDLIETEITLSAWIDLAGVEAKTVAGFIDQEELCFTTPSSALQAHTTEYEGYMGNYGNTLDRWYRRAAIILWPHRHSFAVRAEASPAWALDTLKKHLRSGQLAEPRAMVQSLLPFWAATARHEAHRNFFAKALAVAQGLEDSDLASSLLLPFRLEALTPGRAPALVALTRLYGEDWLQALLAEWTSRQNLHTRGTFVWLASLPRLCEALCTADTAGQRCAQQLVQNRWEALQERIEKSLLLAPPSLRDEAMTDLAKPVLGVLESAEITSYEKLRDEAVAFLCAEGKEPLLPCLIKMLRTAAKKTAPARRASSDFKAIRQHCVRRLTALLELPTRAGDDWSIDLPEGCQCDLCATLRAFLFDPAKQQLEWPIAQQKRQHVHGRIDRHELPVRHTTRRSGRPYTLVLSKLPALFEREAKERRSWQSDLDWLTRTQKV